MAGPIFIARTPRAGRWNHCYLAPPGANLTTEEMAAFVDAVSNANVVGTVFGGNYVGLRRTQVQDGTMRESSEILILIGVAVDRLSSEEKEYLTRVLEYRLGDLGRLVEKIEWQSYPQRPSPATHGDLAVWVKEDFPNGLPGASTNRFSGNANSIAPRSRPKPSSQLAWLVGIVGIVAVLALATLGIMFLASNTGVLDPKNGTDKIVEGISKDKKKGDGGKETPQKVESTEEILKKLTSDLQISQQISEDEFVRELIRNVLKVPDGGPRPTRKELLIDPRTRTFLVEYRDGKRTADGWLFLLKEERGALGKQFQAKKGVSRKEVAELRDHLRLFADAFELFKKGVKKNPNRNPNPDIELPQFAKLANSLNSENPRFSPLPTIRYPKECPWFFKEDVEMLEIWRNVIHRVGQVAKGEQAFPEAMAIKAEAFDRLGLAEEAAEVVRIRNHYQVLLRFIGTLQELERQAEHEK
jgi:hypothetical protein